MADRRTIKDVKYMLAVLANLLGKPVVEQDGEHIVGALVLRTGGGNWWRVEECLPGAGLHAQPFGPHSHKVADLYQILYFAVEAIKYDRERR